MGAHPSTVPGLHGHSELSSGYQGAELLREVLDVVDPYTGVHSRAVMDLSVAVTEVMELDAARRRDVEYAAMLHDVGKIRVPTQIINKPDRLDEAEWELMRRHTIDGETLLEELGGALAVVGRFVRSSHERYDGHGYPDGLAGEQIPIESRIVCACDAYNAMITDRPYCAARRTAAALQELHRCSGSQFDPSVVEAIEAVVQRRFEPRSRAAEPAGVAFK
jgi:HD-GYP domain-containing protein (c-di-GMP phosphodiesterase class II)